MRNKTIYLSFIAVAISILFCSHVKGPATYGYDCTGAETKNGQGNPTGCSASGGCHSTSADASIGVKLELDSAGTAVTNYVGGQSYTIKISGVNNGSTSQPKFGFQISCIKGTTQLAAPGPVNAGTFSSPPANTHIALPLSPYTTLNIFEHVTQLTPAYGSGGTGTTYVESATWTAPVAGTGVVSFWGALNAVNDNGNADNGDLWDTTHITVNEETAGKGGTSGINALSLKDEIKIYPNPLSDKLNIQLSNAQTGSYTISVYNLEGQSMSLQNIDINSGDFTQKINTSGWLPGIYVVTVQRDDSRITFKIVKQ